MYGIDILLAIVAICYFTLVVIGTLTVGLLRTQKVRSMGLLQWLFAVALIATWLLKFSQRG